MGTGCRQTTKGTILGFVYLRLSLTWERGQLENRKATTSLSRLTKSLLQKRADRAHQRSSAQPCTVRTLLHASTHSTYTASGTLWILDSQQERCLSTFHICCLRPILNILWRDKMPKGKEFDRTGIPSVSLSSSIDAFDGWGMSSTRKTEANTRTFFMEKVLATV